MTMKYKDNLLINLLTYKIFSVKITKQNYLLLHSARIQRMQWMIILKKE